MKRSIMVNRRLRKGLITLLVLVCLGGTLSTFFSHWAAGPWNTIPAVTYQGMGAPPPEGELSKLTIRVLSLNLAHGRKGHFNQMLLSKSEIERNLQEVVAAIDRSDVQVAAFQEADAPSFWSGSFNHVRFISRHSTLGYAIQGEHVAAPHLSYGTAVISASPLEGAESHTFQPCPPSLTKGFTAATLEWPGDPKRRITVVSVHFDFLSAHVRTSQATELLTRLKSYSTPLIIMGDFNSDWRSEDSVVRQLVLALKLKVFDPDSMRLVTFPGTGRRLDWILISPELVFRSYEVLQDLLSDHLGVVAEIALNTGTSNGEL